MADLSNFDASQVEPTNDFGPIPAGKYTAIITESEIRPTRSGSGSYLQLTFQICDGEHKNRLLWARLNLDNPNEIAMQIARAELSAICRAVGVLAPRDSTELHNLPLLIHVRCKTRADTGEVVNEIKGYTKKEAPAPAATAQPQVNSAPPWRR